MTRCVSVLVTALLALLVSASAAAETASPALTARIQGIESEATRDQKLRIDSLDIRVRIHGTIAETTITARFGNPGQSILEGDFTLTMPANSVVTGYALDVNGRMVDGVLVDQRQARIAYEARVRQRIDPGLAEVERNNLFRTRVFPIFPESGRTIRLRFVTPLDRRDGYALPLRDTQEIGAFSLGIETTGASGGPSVRVPLGVEADWERIDGGHRFAIERRDVALDGDLTIEWRAPAAPLQVSRHANGEHFFEIADESPQRPRDAAPPVRSAAILWDRSLSRRDDNLDEEIAILRQYLDQVRPQQIELLLFDSGGVERVRPASVEALVARLHEVRYRGATSLGVLSREPVSADSCLLFSDGLVTIDPRDGFQPACPLFALSSAADADRATLASLARGSGGEAFDLTVREAGEVLARMTRAVPRVTDVRTSAGQRVDYRLLDAGETGWRIVGRMPATGDLLVRLGGVPVGRRNGSTPLRAPSPSMTAPARSGPPSGWR